MERTRLLVLLPVCSSVGTVGCGLCTTFGPLGTIGRSGHAVEIVLLAVDVLAQGQYLILAMTFGPLGTRGESGHVVEIVRLAVAALAQVPAMTFGPLGTIGRSGHVVEIVRLAVAALAQRQYLVPAVTWKLSREVDSVAPSAACG